MWMRDATWVRVAVAMSGNLQESVPRWDDEAPGGYVQDDGHFSQTRLFGGGDGHVSENLAGGCCAATEIDQCAGPSSGCEDDEVGVDLPLRAVGELCANDFAPVEEKPLRGAGKEGDSTCLLDFPLREYHGGLRVRPAAGPVDVAPFPAISSCAEYSLYFSLAFQLLNLLLSAVLLCQPCDVLITLPYVCVVPFICGYQQPALVVSPFSAPSSRTFISPQLLRARGKRGVGRRGVVGANDARCVDARAVRVREG